LEYATNVAEAKKPTTAGAGMEVTLAIIQGRDTTEVTPADCRTGA